MRKERLSIFVCADHYGTSRSNFKQPWNNTCPGDRRKYLLSFVFRLKRSGTILGSRCINTIIYRCRTGILPVHIPQNGEIAGCRHCQCGNFMCSPMPSCVACPPPAGGVSSGRWSTLTCRATLLQHRRGGPGDSLHPLP